MKILIRTSFLILLLIVTACQEKQNGFEISANLKDFKENSKVVLLEQQSEKVLDSTVIKDGAFNFKGTLETNPMRLALKIKEPNENREAYTTIFIGNDKVTMTGSKKDFPAMLLFEGSEHQKLKSELEQKTEPYNVEYDNTIQKMIKIRQDGKWNDSLQNAYWGKDGIFQNIDDNILQIKKTFIEENSNTYYALLQLNAMRKDLPEDYVVNQLKKVTPKLKNTEYGKSLQFYLDNEPLKKNDKYFNFTAENQNGKIVQFSDYFNDNRFVLLEFYSPHCGWCKKALPEIKKLAKDRQDELKVVTFNIDKNKTDWLKTNKQNKTDWPSLWDEGGRYSETYTKYRVIGTPTYYLFDANGKMVNKWTGFNENTIKTIKQQLE